MFDEENFMQLIKKAYEIRIYRLTTLLLYGKQFSIARTSITVAGKVRQFRT